MPAADLAAFQLPQAVEVATIDISFVTTANMRENIGPNADPKTKLGSYCKDTMTQTPKFIERAI